MKDERGCDTCMCRPGPGGDVCEVSTYCIRLPGLYWIDLESSSKSADVSSMISSVILELNQATKDIELLVSLIRENEI